MADNCHFCNRRKQISKHWTETKCVCCDVHEGQCKHLKPQQHDEIFEAWRNTPHWMLNPLSGKVELITLSQQKEFVELWREKHKFDIYIGYEQQKFLEGNYSL